MTTLIFIVEVIYLNVNKNNNATCSKILFKNCILIDNAINKMLLKNHINKPIENTFFLINYVFTTKVLNINCFF